MEVALVAYFEPEVFWTNFILGGWKDSNIEKKMIPIPVE